VCSSDLALSVARALCTRERVQHDEQEERQLNSLVIIYENMKPKDAARIFEELDMVVLLDVIERMKERKTAPILAELNPKRAKTITIELAHRRNLPGTAKD
jgi:flagellar motility protein MotE (MotC chaperone)